MVTFPDSIMYVFSPNYVNISGEPNARYVNVSVGGQTITSAVYNGNASINISGISQMSFDDPENTRSLTLTINVSGDVSATKTVLAIWGSVSPEFPLGQFANSDNIRKVHYFKNFPFDVHLLTDSGFIIKTPSDDTQYTSSSSLGAVTTKVIVRNEIEGLYLRWIDSFGFRQYFLFSLSTLEAKNKLSDYKLQYLTKQSLGGYSIFTRPLSIRSTKTVKACAISLDADTIEYVASIISSPLIDAYLNDDWVPVNISSGTYKYSKHHLVTLQDLEISVELPAVNSQII